MQREYKSRETGRTCIRMTELEFIGMLQRMPNSEPEAQFAFKHIFELIFEFATIKNYWPILNIIDKRLYLENEKLGSIQYNNNHDAYIITQFGDTHNLGQLNTIMIDQEDLETIINIATPQ